MAELVEHLKAYSYDRFDILTMWDMNELPEFVHTDFGDENTVADEVLGDSRRRHGRGFQFSGGASLLGLPRTPRTEKGAA